MRLAEIRIENFRAFRDETIRLDDYTCMVGPNGSGKSTVLTALNIFFRNTASAATDLVNLTEEDFHGRDTSRPITITVTFDELQPEAQTDFAHYYRQEKLIISAVAVWNAGLRSATVKQFGERVGIKSFAPFFEAEGEGKLVSELKTVYSEIQKKFSNLPGPGTKPSMIAALHDYETTHPDLCEPIPSEDQFYGVSKGRNLLQKYIQWAYVPAVKDASTEQLESRKTGLGILLERTVRSRISFEKPLNDLRKNAEEVYLKILEENRGALSSLSESLSLKLKEWAHPDTHLTLKWNDDTSKAISISEPLAKILAGEGLFEGELARFGHGLQRSFLLALLQEIAGSEQTGGPKLLLACEEPELYQHPPQARHLAAVLDTLSSQNAQVIVSTHSPYFVSGKGFESVRMFRKPTTSGEAHAHAYTFGDLSAAIAAANGEKPITLAGTALKVHQALSPAINEMFLTSVLVLVEGVEDAAYLATYIALMEKWGDFRRLGCHIVPAGGKSELIRPIAVAKGLQIPTFVVFDGDDHKPDVNGSRKKHEKDNTTILRLRGITNPDPFPSSTFWSSDTVMWNSEVGKVVKDEFGEEPWTKLGEAVRKKYDLHGVGGLNKNSSFIGYLLAEGWEAKIQSASLCKLCDAVIAFAESAKGG
jgi:putative ATP-dependent endonuclease of OLD family